ncbi:hypothetical protein ACLMJK_001056 [Lecanora helva]
MPPTSRTTFSSLPREIRDQIYELTLSTTHRSSNTSMSKAPNALFLSPWTATSEVDLSIRGDELPLSLLNLLVKWARKSHIAQEACEAFYAANIFMIHSEGIPKCLESHSSIMFYSRSALAGERTHIRLRTPQCLQLKSHIRNVIIEVRASERQLVTTCSRTELSQTLTRILGFPQLKGVKILISSKLNHDGTVAPYSMTDREFVSALACVNAVCLALRRRIGLCARCIPYAFRSRPSSTNVGLKVFFNLRKYWRYTGYEDRGYWQDVTWVWDPPDDQMRKRVKTGTATRREMVRVRAADDELLVLNDLPKDSQTIWRVLRQDCG